MPGKSPEDVAGGGGGDTAFVSIPRGGPIFIPDMVGPLTRVPDFENLIFHELQAFKADLDFDSLDLDDEDISVDELKIFSEEELVSMAFKEAFKDNKTNSKEDSTKNTENPSSSRIQDQTCTDIGREMLPSESSNNLTLKACQNKKKNNNKSTKKRKRQVQQKNDILEENYMEKVEELAIIKQKQEQDKALAKLHSFNGSCKNKECVNISYKKSGKMTCLKGTSTAKARPSIGNGNIEVKFPEIILCVEVYHSRKTWVKVQEFLVLGQQFLTEVKDKIYCMTDEIMKKAGENNPSGYFLIEDVFYNDMRDPSATNYSKPILNWLENSKKEALEKWEYIINGELQQKQKAIVGNETELQLPRFRSVEMEKTRFCDLRFRVGGGYLYCHQGDCKHVMVIRDMRLIDEDDVKNRVMYPLIVYQSKLRFRKCSVCQIFKAEKITVDDKLAEENPCYFCDLCYYMTHYVDKTLLYSDFSVYDYLHE